MIEYRSDRASFSLALLLPWTWTTTTGAGGRAGVGSVGLRPKCFRQKNWIQTDKMSLFFICYIKGCEFDSLFSARNKKFFARPRSLINAQANKGYLKNGNRQHWAIDDTNGISQPPKNCFSAAVDEGWNLESWRCKKKRINIKYVCMCVSEGVCDVVICNLWGMLGSMKASGGRLTGFIFFHRPAGFIVGILFIFLEFYMFNFKWAKNGHQIYRNWFCQWKVRVNSTKITVKLQISIN